MKKNVKTILIVLGALISLVSIDTIQTKLFNNKPILKIVEDYNGGDLYQKHKGVLVDTYVFTDGTQEAVFKWKKYSYHTENNQINNSAKGQDFDVVLSFANYTDASEIYFGALNRGKMAISSIQHLPIYKFNTFEDLEQFKLTFGEIFSMKSGWDEVPSFNDATIKYDKTFFEENTLLLVYVSSNNSTHRFGVNNIFCDGKSFSIHLEETTKAETVDTAMAGWFVTVAVTDSMIENCTEFDADLDNFEN